MMNSDLAADPYYGYSLVKVVEYLECSMSRDILGKFPDNSSYDFDYSQSSIWSPLIPRPSPGNLRNSCDDIPEKPSVHDDEDGFHGFSRIKNVTLNIKRKFAGSSSNFDNSQSSIWPPLVPRPSPRNFLNPDEGIPEKTALLDDDGYDGLNGAKVVTDSSFDFDDSQSSIWSPLIPRPSPRNLLNSGDIPEMLVLDDDEFNGIARIMAVTANFNWKFTDTVKDNLQMYQKLKKGKTKKSQDFSPMAYTSRKGWGKVLKAASKQFKKMKKKDGSIAHMNFRRCVTGGG